MERADLARLRCLPWPPWVLLAIGGAFTRQQRGTSDFFLARRRIPWWAACLSFLATEISAVTIISVPATAYARTGSTRSSSSAQSLAKFVVALLFIPAFYRYDCMTIYEFLAHRFGTASQVTASIFFFVSRLLGSGVRLMAAVPRRVGAHGLAALADDRAVQPGVHRLHRARRREGGGVDERVPGAPCSCWAAALTVAFLASQIDGGLGDHVPHRGRGRAPERDQLGPRAGRRRLLAPRALRSQHRLAGPAQRPRGLDRRLRHRSRPDAAPPDGRDAQAEPAHAGPHPARHPRHPGHLPRASAPASSPTTPSTRARGCRAPTRSSRSSSAPRCRRSCAG